MGLFGFLKAPGKILNRLTGATNSRKQMNAVKDDMERVRNNLGQANAQSAAQQKQLQKMLDEISGLEREQKSVHKDYKNKLRAIEYEEHHLKGLGQHYTKTTGQVEAKGNALMSRKSQLEERSARLEGKAAPLEQKLKDLAEQTKPIDGEEIKALVEQYQQKFKEVETSKERLKGISKETSPELFTQHQKMVKALGTLHKQTEETVKSKHAGLSDTHKRIALELNRIQQDYRDIESEGRDIRRGQEKLDRKVKHLDTYQNMLAPELRKFAEDQEAFKGEAEGLKGFQQKLTDLEKGYTEKKNEAEKLQKELTGTGSYQEQLVDRLRGLQGTLDFIGDRYQHQAGNARLLGGIGTAALALGTLGTGALGALGAGAGSMLTMNAMQKDVEQNLKRWGVYQDTDGEALNSGGSRIPDWNRTPLNRVDFKSRVFDTKIRMPEFGGLAQSIRHFEMPTLPTLAELPQLSEALGKIRSLEDVANLGVLPGSTARSPNRSLLNPQLMQTFQSLIKSKGLAPKERVPLGRVPPGRASNNNKKKGHDPKGGASLASLPRLGRLDYGR